MNKIFTSLMLMAAAFGAAAQSFTVSTPDGKTYADGDEVNCSYSFSGYGYDWEPGLQVTVDKETSPLGGSSFSVTVSASEPGVVRFCGLSTECAILGSDPVTNSKSFKLGQTFPLSIDIYDYPTKPEKTIVATVKITDGTETVNLKVNFLPTEAAGIAEVEVGNGTLSFVGRTMHYGVEQPSKFSLYNISGRAVVDRTLSGAGSLSFASIPAGVYIYRLGTKTGKVLLK